MTAQRILRPATAFSVASTKQKRPRVEDAAHLRWIKTLHCCICGKPDPDPAHIRSSSPVHGKREVGGAEKASDKWLTPLCREHHDEQHAGNEIKFWAKYGIDPFGLALALHSASGDDEIADAILRANMPRAAVTRC
jgi:hypothetical protein